MGHLDRLGAVSSNAAGLAHLNNKTLTKSNQTLPCLMCTGMLATLSQKSETWNPEQAVSTQLGGQLGDYSATVSGIEGRSRTHVSSVYQSMV